ncbi:hypothetical protein ACFU3E_28100 [Streptomyces sp. NPDC057424]|uniref:hypothetical protein n=1 Tax=Streptomyces sp. NPDC057424 TaxID=3346127 RepID=UPI0036B5A70D
MVAAEAVRGHRGGTDKLEHVVTRRESAPGTGPSLPELDRDFHEVLYAFLGIDLGTALRARDVEGAQRAMAVHFRGIEARAGQEQRDAG